MDRNQIAALQPLNQFNRKLVDHVHPENWVNPRPDQPYHLVVIGAGTAGLVTAAGAAGLGARVALIERELMGGDCLNVGCVPSKSLLAAAGVAAGCRRAGGYGIKVSDVEIDFPAVMDRMRAQRASISQHDSATRFHSLGVDVYLGQASFGGENSINVVDDRGEPISIPFKKAVIATGARAASPEIPGIESIDCLTNETLFSLTECPQRLGIIGGGPIGCEMAQAFARFNSQVFLLDRNHRVLHREDADATDIVQQQLQRDGVKLLLGAENLKFKSETGNTISIDATLDQSGQRISQTVDRLLVAAGRAPNVESLNLEAVGVATGKSGISVNDFLQTTNPAIYACGDVCSTQKFTHSADYQARIVIQNALFAIGPFGRKRNSGLLIPRVTYTSPELAQVGHNETSAQGEGLDYDVYAQPLAEVDRAIVEGVDQGIVKVLTRKGKDQVIGATIVAPHAGDLISQLTQAMQHGVGLSDIANTIHPYPDTS